MIVAHWRNGRAVEAVLKTVDCNRSGVRIPTYCMRVFKINFKKSQKFFYTRFKAFHFILLSKAH
jgi:hypothetical protein